MKRNFKSERLIEAAVLQIKDDIGDGDVTAIEELLMNLSYKKVLAFLSERRTLEFQRREKEIKKFIKDWGQSHSEITAELGYPEEESDDLLMVDYFWNDETQKWFPKSSSLYTGKEQEIAEIIRYS